MTDDEGTPLSKASNRKNRNLINANHTMSNKTTTSTFSHVAN